MQGTKSGTLQVLNKHRMNEQMITHWQLKGSSNPSSCYLCLIFSSIHSLPHSHKPPNTGVLGSAQQLQKYRGHSKKSRTTPPAQPWKVCCHRQSHRAARRRSVLRSLSIFHSVICDPQGFWRIKERTGMLMKVFKTTKDFMLIFLRCSPHPQRI